MATVYPWSVARKRAEILTRHITQRGKLLTRSVDRFELRLHVYSPLAGRLCSPNYPPPWLSWAKAENTTWPPGRGKIKEKKKRASTGRTKINQMTWTGLSRFCFLFHDTAFAFQSRRGPTQFMPLRDSIPPSSPKPRISLHVSSTIPCLPTATSLKLLFGSRPWKWDGAPLTPSPKVKSLAPNACTKAPVKYYSVLHACDACACATNRASSELQLSTELMKPYRNSTQHQSLVTAWSEREALLMRVNPHRQCLRERGSTRCSARSSESHMALAPKLPSPLGKATGLQAQAPVLIPQIITISDGYQPYGYFSYGHCCSYLAAHQLKASHSASPLVITAR